MPTQLEAAPTATKTAKSFRLPKTVVPRRYELRLAPDLQNLTFQGRLTIEVMVKAPTETIVLNAVDLEFDEVYVECADGSNTRLNGSVSLDPETELAEIAFQGVLGAGLWHLKITFRGELSEKLRGFYRSTFLDKLGVKHTIASTHFEPTHARRAFPCFDEPEFKATFKIFLEVDDQLTALSNGRAIREEKLADEKKRVEFAETMLLSTYLVAFVVGDFRASRTVKVNGTAITIYSAPGKEHLTEFALAVAAFAVEFYESYFEIPYPQEKIDHVAIPDFPIGAMENLGLITYRETALLVDHTQSSHSGLVRVAEIIMHELAHMWFGDLVTMDWWNGLWLKESFATFMANICLDAYRPHWQVWNDFAQARADALQTDSLASTHAIENPVNHPDEATEMFDVISYQKGCSVLYQLHEFIGKETFRLGCSRYLRAHSYDNTETHQLWDALEEACREAHLDVPVRSLMDTWIYQPGHPVVSVEAHPSPGFIVLRQKMFRFWDEDDLQKTWPIPLIIRVLNKSGDEEIKKLVMDSKEQTVYVGEEAACAIVNAHGSGFYRVIYERSLAQAVLGQMSKLSAVERYNLVNDAWSTVRAGLMPVADYLAIVRLYTRETDCSVWQLLYNSLDHVSSLLDQSDKPLLTKFVRELTDELLEILTWKPKPDDPVETRKLRALILKLRGVVGEDDVVRFRAREFFDGWKQEPDSLDAEMVPAIIHIAAIEGNEKLYSEFLRMSRSASTPQDTIRFLYALARFQNKELISKTAHLCLSDEIRSQDAPYVFGTLLQNPMACDIAWDFLKANFEEMKRRYPDIATNRMVESLALFDTTEQAQDVRKFFAHHSLRTGETAVKQTLEQLKVNARLRHKEKAAVKAALETQPN